MNNRYITALLALVCVSNARADVFNMPAGQTSLQFVTVGDPGNAADSTVMLTDNSTGYGAVNYVFRIGKYDVTNAQYCQFLNAVAKDDPFALYSNDMAESFGGITRGGNSGSYVYAVIEGRANLPVNNVSWGDSVRFTNWLSNNQPTGASGPGITETGAYTLGGATSDSDLNAVVRNSGATYFLPTEDEWYKAAYFKGGSTNAGYWLYATQSDADPSNLLSSSGTNNANYLSGGPNEVGAFASSPSHYGTFDQAGNVAQWNEASLNSSFYRGLRGGNWGDAVYVLTSQWRNGTIPTLENNGTGFRVASIAVPEPSTLVLAVFASLMVGGLGVGRAS
jgi:formylglycine-generating enzyme required for sulfatase activity